MLQLSHAFCIRQLFPTSPSHSSTLPFAASVTKSITITHGWRFPVGHGHPIDDLTLSLPDSAHAVPALNSICPSETTSAERIHLGHSGIHHPSTQASASSVTAGQLTCQLHWLHDQTVTMPRSHPDQQTCPRMLSASEHLRQPVFPNQMGGSHPTQCTGDVSPGLVGHGAVAHTSQA